MAGLVILPLLSLPVSRHPRRTAGSGRANDRISYIQSIEYEEAAPYFEALFVWRLDARAWYCADNNFDKLPDRPVLRWLAERATPAYLDAAKNAGVTITSTYRGSRTAGDSPWGAFLIPEIRGLMEQPFADAKRHLVEALRERDAGEKESAALSSDAAQASPATGPAGS